MATALIGLSALAPLQKVEEETPFLTPEQRYGGPVDPYHSQHGELARPYPWESSITQGGSHGPYGPENQLLGDDYWFTFNGGGDESQDPDFDYNMPNVTKSHGAPHTVTISGPLPSQYGAICTQSDQSYPEHSQGTNASKKMQTWDDPLQDHWAELLNNTPGHDDLVPVTGQVSFQSSGFGVNDRLSNTYAKRNTFGYETAHAHRRYATGSIPGNYMWMRPGGRPMVKGLPGPARPAIGIGSPFEGDDLGMAFGIDGAILQTQPTEYVPPPSPYLASANENVSYGNPYGTDGFEAW